MDKKEQTVRTVKTDPKMVTKPQVRPQAKPRKQKKLAIGIALLIAVLLVVIGFLYTKYHNLSEDPQNAAKATTKKVVTEVGELYLIPTDEEPTVAQVQDRAKLQGQVFFDKAQDGDYILVYSKNKLAMIYRQKDHKLINVGPININNTPEGQTTPNPQPTVNNSTTKPGN